jgi:hypothetical protein
VVNVPKANAFYIDAHDNPHISVILHPQNFIFRPWKIAENFASSDIKNNFQLLKYLITKR